LKLSISREDNLITCGIFLHNENLVANKL